jgi:hypothetical protein
MKFVAIVSLALFLSSPALAAPQWVEDACWKAATRVRPILRPGEKEAYVTNCIADWTAGTAPPSGQRSYNRNRY